MENLSYKTFYSRPDPVFLSTFSSGNQYTLFFPSFDGIGVLFYFGYLSLVGFFEVYDS